MDDILYNQLYVLGIFIVTGIVIGLIFDVFRAQRRVVKTSNFITYIQDFVFWILSGLVIIIASVTYTNGEIRSYMVWGLICGLIFYFFILSKYILKVEVFIIDWIVKLIRTAVCFFAKCIKFICFPLMYLIKKLKKFIINKKTSLNSKKTLEKEI